jgi:putative transferase (TIGR04331 family)
VFLATTALGDFWDTRGRMVFLGSWCLRYDRRAQWSSLAYEVMPSPWDDRKRLYDAARYLDEVGERMLDRLTEYLNTTHDVSHDRRYWRILLGPWLIVYLHALYDRYVCLEEAFKTYRELETLVLDPRCFRTPPVAAEAVRALCDDAYNLQVYSQVLAALGHAFPSRPLPEESRPTRAPGPRPGWKGRARALSRRGVRLLERAAERLGRRGWVAVSDLALPPSTRWRLALRSGLRLVPLMPEWDVDPDGVAVVFDRRRTGLAALPASDPFERVLVQTLPQNLPAAYLEAYARAREATRRRHPRPPAAIVTETGWYSSEPFKYLAAESAAQGTRLVASQHGLAYGMYRFMPYYLHELRVSDTFLAWGWAPPESERHRNWPSPGLSVLAPRRRPPARETVLMLATSQPPYLYLFHSSPVGSQWEEYFEWQRRFLHALSPRSRAAVRFRPHVDDHHHSVWARIADRFPDVRLDDGRPVGKAMARSRMVVLDHPGTSLLESMRADVPTVAFWDSQRWEMREEAEPSVEALRRAGIVWHSPDEAAMQVTRVFDDPWEWWARADIRAVREAFVGRYALGRRDWERAWVAGLRSLP